MALDTLARRALLLLVLSASTACATSTTEDDGEGTASDESALTAAGPKLTFASGVVVPVAAVRSTTNVELTALPERSTAALQLVVAPGVALGRLASQDGAKAALTLGGGVYDLGPSDVTSIAFPSVAAKPGDKTNAFITVAFKPTEIKYMKASGDVAKPSIGPSSSASVTSFSLALGGATSASSMILDAFTLHPDTPGAVLGATMAEADAGAWATWADGERRDGTLRYAGPAGTVDLALRGVSLAKKKPAKDKNAWHVELYVEEIQVKGSI